MNLWVVEKKDLPYAEISGVFALTWRIYYLAPCCCLRIELFLTFSGEALPGSNLWRQ